MRLDELRRRFRGDDTVKYTIMLRKDACILLEFGNINMFMKAQELLDIAFPDSKRLSSSTDGHKLILNTEEEVTYFRLIEANLK